MHIVKIGVDQIEEYVQKVKAVYFFGSHKNAKSLYSLCAKYFVEFYPEVEAADCKILKQDSLTEEDILNDIKTTFTNSFTHEGMVFQRIGGLLIHIDNYKAYINKLEEHVLNTGFSPLTSPNQTSEIEKSIFESTPGKVLKDKDTYIVISPNLNSEFALNAYFNRVLWVSSFVDTNSLIAYLNKRRFFLGLNIITDNTDFQDKVIEQTNFSRYTLHATHSDVINDTGWGGNWPSGSGGYKSWYDTFSNKFVVLK